MLPAEHTRSRFQGALQERLGQCDVSGQTKTAYSHDLGPRHTALGIMALRLIKHRQVVDAQERVGMLRAEHVFCSVSACSAIWVALAHFP